LFDFYDVGAKIAKHSGRMWPRQHSSEVKYANPI